MKCIKRKLRSDCVVYGLCEPGTETVKYIGQTKLSASKRLSFHFRSVNKKLNKGHRLSPVQAWVYELRGNGQKPAVIILEARGTWDVSEVIWIERYRAAGHNLLNVLRGGNDSYDAVVRETGYKPAPLYKPIDDLEREFRNIIGL